MAYMDYVLNGESHGQVADQMKGLQFDPGLLRPYITKNNKKCVTINTGRTKYNEKTGLEEPIFEQRLISDLQDQGIDSPVFNVTSLRKDEWKMLDRAVIRASRQRLRAWADLEARNPFAVPGMSKMLLEHETMSDPGSAMVDMDGLSEGQADSPRFQLEGIPLPITHSDFYFSKRRLAVSRNSGTPIDSVMAEAAGRRVGETIEKTLIGVETGITYGTAADYQLAPTVRGYTNHPDRLIKTNMTAPTGSNGATILTDWLALRELLYVAKFYGPYMVYTSSDYDEFLDNLFSTTEPSAGTLRTRLLQIDGLLGIKRLDFLTNTFTVLMVQMSPEVVQAVTGMDITTVQWEAVGGMRLNFKVMAIKVPRIRSQFGTTGADGDAGFAHGTTA